MDGKIKVGVIGATGAVGQRFVQLLANHPWFELTELAASDRSAGKPYGEACRWVLPEAMPEAARGMIVRELTTDLDCEVVFSALPGDIAGPTEEELAAAGYIVCSNASAHRMDPDVPLLIPEVNPEHLGLLEVQRRRRGWRGAIVTNPNCTATGLAAALKPLHDAFGLRRVFVVSMQAISGAGYPGLASLDIVDNLIPYIGGEESKLETEPRKMLGRWDGDRILEADFRISAHCNRVAVREGHTECVSVELARRATAEEVIAAWREYKGLPQQLGLPTAPEKFIEVRSEPDRPQPLRDRDAGRGMTTTVGRLRPCSLLDWKFVLLSHNTLRGAAGASVLNAELMAVQGYFSRRPEHLGEGSRPHSGSTNR